ncbi:MAG: tRNA (N(6)-L-threonylcarbamoyladenosine(37)-C(2))-methylthiotransferase MtaB [Ignavibacteria bacterium]|jgi:threonylcarbamoyladenosine tRNA methylthiotransferase MtaB
MRISFHTLGCKLNYSETSQLRDQYEKLGHEIVPFGNETDAVIINTCTVTENADTECRKIIRKIQQVSPEAFIGVTGCYAQLKSHEIASIPGVDAVIGTSDKLRIDEIISDYSKRNKPELHVSSVDDAIFSFSQSADEDSRTRAFLKIQDGCDYSCSFCTIPLARGKSRSIDISEIPNRIRQLEEQEYHEIILSGINLGDYSHDDSSFIDVLHLIESLDTKARFRIGSIEPNLVNESILRLIASSNKIVPHLHMPLQSGSKSVLKRMKRRYKISSYYDNLILCKQLMPNACIGADVIVGFPGETDQEYEETFTFIEQLPFSYLHVFTYSERDNTPAANYDDTIPMRIRKLRNARLRALSDSKRRVFYESQIGSSHKVIPESFDESTGLWRGWTENYVRVQFSGTQFLNMQPYAVQLEQYDHVSGTVTSTLLEDPQLNNGYIQLSVI